MKTNCKTILATTITAIGMTGMTYASSVFVDFSSSDISANTGTEFYNVINDPSDTNTVTSPIATSTAITASDLNDTLGNLTTTDVTIATYNNGSGQLRGSVATGGALGHDAVAGVEANASNDSFWVNNHNSNEIGAGNEFGFVLTFSDLTEPLYNITLLVGSGNLAGSWAVTTGTGDTDTPAFSGQDDTLSWTSVAAVGGVIELTGTSVPTAKNFQNTTISFASITVVPEPSSTALLGLGGLALIMRRRK